jgi:hypothetical protein
MAKMVRKNMRSSQRAKKEKEVKKPMKKIIKPIKKMTDRGHVTRNSDKTKATDTSDQKYLRIVPSLIGCKIKRHQILSKRSAIIKRVKEGKRKEAKKNPNRVIE